MHIETLAQKLKNPMLQAGLVSAWWTAEDAELILSALERSGLTVRELAKRTQIGAALDARRRQQRKWVSARPPSSSPRRPRAADSFPNGSVNATLKTTNIRCSVRPRPPTSIAK